MIYLANSSKQQIGGGWTFLDNFRKALSEQITDNYEEATWYFIAGATMVQREDVLRAKEEGKKIALRVDNALRNSRNRNTGMTRMKDFAEWADLIIYQSNWSRKYLMPYLGHDGVVIHNAVDTEIFNNQGRTNADHQIFLYSRFNRDETKNWEVARYWFSTQFQKDRSSELWIVGNFSPELVEGNFDFYRGERYKFWNVLPLEQLPSIYKHANQLIYTYYNDACSNTLIEALSCGLRLTGDPYYQTTGGAPEIISKFQDERFSYDKGLEYFSLKRLAFQYKEAMNVR